MVLSLRRNCVSHEFNTACLNYENNNHLDGIPVTHVDDFCWGGIENFRDSVRPLNNVFSVSSVEMSSQVFSKYWQTFIGQLSWITTQSYPDITFAICELSSVTKINHLFSSDANKQSLKEYCLSESYINIP